MAAGWWSLLACASPLGTTGEVHEVMVREGISPAEVIARPGDRIRWVNLGGTPVEVAIVSGPLDAFGSCGNRLFDSGDERLRIEPTDFATRCLAAHDTVTYSVRKLDPVPGRQFHMPGTVRIGRPEGLPTAPLISPQG